MENNYLSQEMAQDFNDNSIATSSEGGFRNEENLSGKTKIDRYVKREENKSFLLLPIKQFVANYDPRNLKVTSDFNNNHKYRPSLAFSTAMRLIIANAIKDEDMKAKFEAKYGFVPTEEMLGAPISAEMIKGFRKEVLPTIFSIPAVKINDVAITRSNFPKKYAVEVTREDLRGLSSEDRALKEPKYMRLQGLLNTIVSNKVEAFKATDDYKNKSDKDQRTSVRAFWDSRQILGDCFDNRIACITLPLDEEGKISVDINSMTTKDIQNLIVFEKLAFEDDNLIKNIKVAIEGNKAADIQPSDIYPDFYEVLVSTGTVDIAKKQVDEFGAIQEATIYKPTTKVMNQFGEQAVIRITEAINDLTQNGHIDYDTCLVPMIAVSRLSDTVETKLFESVAQQSKSADFLKYLKEDDIEEHMPALVMLGQVEGKDLVELLLDATDDGDVEGGKTDRGSVDEGEKANTDSEDSMPFSNEGIFSNVVDMDKTSF